MKPLLEISGADWIAPRLGGEFGAITRFVPSGYAAYARLCHPASDDAGGQVSWSQVATATGHQAHPTMQWHALIGSNDYLDPRSDLWPGQNPDRGTIEPEVMAILCAVLAAHTSTPDDCRFALWDGFGWIHSGPTASVSASNDGVEPSDKSPDPIPAGLGHQQLAGPRIRHPGRDYLLFEGALHPDDQSNWQITQDQLVHQTPNMCWPIDRAWFMATEIDLDSTIIAGSPGLINAILATPDLDAWPLQPDDSVAANADTINS